MSRNVRNDVSQGARRARPEAYWIVRRGSRKEGNEVAPPYGGTQDHVIYDVPYKN